MKHTSVLSGGTKALNKNIQGVHDKILHREKLLILGNFQFAICLVCD